MKDIFDKCKFGEFNLNSRIIIILANLSSKAELLEPEHGKDKPKMEDFYPKKSLTDMKKWQKAVLV